MSKPPRFWRNVALIGLAHVALVAGLVRWNREAVKPVTPNVVWMNTSADDGAQPGPAPALAHAAVTAPAEVSTPAPQADAAPPADPEEDRPALTSLKSDIQLPAQTPTPTATPTPKPSATPAVKVPPRPSPKPHKPTPTPSAKPTPRPTLRPSPKPPKKLILAKASPKPKPTPVEQADEDDAADTEKNKIAEETPARNESASENADNAAKEKPVRKALVAHGGEGEGASTGKAGHGAGGASQFGWYANMLHDRFYSEWIQPTTSVSSNSKISAVVKIRIEKDGRVSSFEIIKPSGNVMIDESVGAIAKHVQQVDPLPAGLGNGGQYDVKINFELNAEQ